MQNLLRQLLVILRHCLNYLKLFLFRLRGIKLDPSVQIHLSAEIHPGGGDIYLGKGSSLAKGVMLRAFGGSIEIGSDCTVNPYCILDGGGGLVIGNGVRIASHTVIVASNHNFSDPNKFIHEQGLSGEGIVIEDDVWIGAGAQVLDGVTISKGTVIGAGSVVTKSTEPNSVVVGVPARKISSRGEASV